MMASKKVMLRSKAVAGAGWTVVAEAELQHLDLLLRTTEAEYAAHATAVIDRRSFINGVYCAALLRHAADLFALSAREGGGGAGTRLSGLSLCRLPHP